VVRSSWDAAEETIGERIAPSSDPAQDRAAYPDGSITSGRFGPMDGGRIDHSEPVRPPRRSIRIVGMPFSIESRKRRFGTWHEE